MKLKDEIYLCAKCKHHFSLVSEEPCKSCSNICDCKHNYEPLKERQHDATGKLIAEFLEIFEQVEAKMIFELKNGTWNADIKNKTKDAKYWKGYRYGLQAFWGDWVLPEKEKWEKRRDGYDE